MEFCAFLLNPYGMAYSPGEKIGIARSKKGPKGWSQSDLAAALAKKRALGIDNITKWRSRIANYENNRPTPPPEPLKLIAEALGVSLSWFYEPEDDTPVWKGVEIDGAGVSTFASVVPIGKIRMIYAGETPCSTNWGDPLSGGEDIEVDARFAGRDRFVTRFVNDSCYPALKEGDLGIWERDNRPNFGVIVLAQRKGDHACTAKMLAVDTKTLTPKLLPINPQTEPPSNGEGWGAIARLVGVIRDEDGLEQTWHRPSGLRPKDLIPAM